MCKSNYLKTIVTLFLLTMIFFIFGLANTYAAIDDNLNVSVRSISSSSSPSTNYNFKVENISNSDINLAELKIKYFVFFQKNDGLVFKCDSSSIDKSKIKCSYNNSLNYLEITFAKNAGIIKAKDVIELDVNMTKENWLQFTSIPVYINDDIVTGMEPSFIKELECATDDILNIHVDEAEGKYNWEYKIDNDKVLQFVDQSKIAARKDLRYRFKSLEKGKATLEMNCTNQNNKLVKKRIYKISVDNTPLVESYDKFKRIANYKTNPVYYLDSEEDYSYMTEESSMGGFGSLSLAQKNTSSYNTSDYSQTNIQVEGVDEADVVKNDGNYIYQLNSKNLNIVGSEKLDLISSLKLEDYDITPNEMYVHKDKLIVIGSTTGIDKADESLIIDYRDQAMTKSIIFDIKDRSNIKLIREIVVNGDYSTSRKAGSSLYLIANKYIGDKINTELGLLPCVLDSAYDEQYKIIGYDKITYFPGFNKFNYIMTIASINLDDNKSPANFNSFLDSSSEIYMSPNNLYITGNRNYYSTTPNEWSYYITYDLEGNSNNILSNIYRFNLKNDQINYKDNAKVPGYILNQFSMDEFKGKLRVATTNTSVYPRENDLYILDEDMKTIGKITGMAPGKTIQSVRFTGEKAYIVTTDKEAPFSVIGLSDPNKPSILGDLKIPGNIEYLHPYDENHIIGVGKDSMIIGNNSTYNQGVKLSMFDVTDIKNPIEKFQTTIGDNGTTTELLTDHKALLFSKEKNLFALPVKVHELSDAQKEIFATKKQALTGSYSYQGAYVYGIDLEKGFNLKSRISHQNLADLKKRYDSAKHVKRILYIGDRLFTVSNGMIKANSLNDFTEINKVELPN